MEKEAQVSLDVPLDVEDKASEKLLERDSAMEMEMLELFEDITLDVTVSSPVIRKGKHRDFHADKPKKRFYWTSFVVDKVTSQDCIDAAHVAVEEFNNLKGADLKFLKLLNVTSRITGGIFYFLTLQCTDERFYEAKIFITLEGARDLFMFRPAKHYPRPR
uniref:Cystatin domain-containing protein n=1 Tax=Cannabis sativa TaxID=3483 RepID=A0A803PLA4_CANSA